MALDSVSGAVFREAAIPGLTDVGAIGSSTTDQSGTKKFPNLTPAQAAANAKAAGAATTATTGGDPLTKAAGGALDKTAFLQLLVKELTNQDPLKPADNTQFIAQLAQFSSLEQMQNLNDGFKNLKTSVQAAQARGMLGVPVKAVDSSTGAPVDGIVDQVILNADGTVRLDVNGTPVNLSDIVSVGPGATTGASTNSGTSGASLPGTLVPPSSGTTTSGSGH